MRDEFKKKEHLDWYDVKIIKQIIIKGEPNPKLVDESFDDDGKQNFVESVMLIRAQSFNHAYKLAKKEQKRAMNFIPVYMGQQVARNLI